MAELTRFQSAIRDTLFAVLTDSDRESLQFVVRAAQDKPSAAQAAIQRYLETDFQCFPLSGIGRILDSLPSRLAPSPLVAAACDDAWSAVDWEAIANDPLVSPLLDRLRTQRSAAPSEPTEATIAQSGEDTPSTTV